MTRQIFLFVLMTLAALSAPASAQTDLNAALTELKSFVQKGVEAYRKGSIEEAEANFSDAYFVTFEEGGIEKEVRQKISGKRAFQLEQMFHKLRRLALEKKGISLLEAEAARTIAEVSKDIKTLKKNKR